MTHLPKAVISTEGAHGVPGQLAGWGRERRSGETCISDYPKLCHLDRSMARPCGVETGSPASLLDGAQRPLYFEGHR
jgi:hypothetical protein